MIREHWFPLTPNHYTSLGDVSPTARTTHFTNSFQRCYVSKIVNIPTMWLVNTKVRSLKDHLLIHLSIYYRNRARGPTKDSQTFWKKTQLNQYMETRFLKSRVKIQCVTYSKPTDNQQSVLLPSVVWVNICLLVEKSAAEDERFGGQERREE